MRLASPGTPSDTAPSCASRTRSTASASSANGVRGGAATVASEPSAKAERRSGATEARSVGATAIADDRSGYCVPTELFERNDQVDGVGAESVVLFGDDETVDAGLGEALPGLLARLGVTVVPRTDDGEGMSDWVGSASMLRLKVLVGGVERESHRSAFGRPSRRSAMTFF